MMKERDSAMTDEQEAPPAASTPESAATVDPAGAAESPDSALRGEDPRLATLNDRLLLALADAENARKRADRARSEGRETGVAEVTASLVPALDSLALAIETAGQEDRSAPGYMAAVLEGLNATNRAILDALSRYGVFQVKPEPGAPFDPNLHEAVGSAPDQAAAPGHVVRTVQTGYKVGDRLVRPVRVIVAAG